MVLCHAVLHPIALAASLREVDFRSEKAYAESLGKMRAPSCPPAREALMGVAWGWRRMGPL